MQIDYNVSCTYTQGDEKVFCRKKHDAAYVQRVEIYFSESYPSDQT